MEWQEVNTARRRLAKEQGAIVKEWGGRLPVALIYPNTYAVGMSGLGFQTIYGQLNAFPDVVCERCFSEPVPGDRPPISQETQRPLSDFAVLAFSVTYELDYWHVVSVLRAAGLPLLAAQRDDRHPLVIGGGPAVTGNPEPVAELFDAIVIGESEPVLPGLFQAIEDGLQGDKSVLLQTLALLPGVYVPSLPSSDGINKHSKQPVIRQYAPDLEAFATHSVVLTRATEFGDMYLLEAARGCGHGCRFCMARSITGPVRERSVEVLLAQAKQGLAFRRKIGLVGAATSDYGHMTELVAGLRAMGASIGVSSLRADSLNAGLLAALVASGTRTVTLAPEAGSQRMRQRIGKGLNEEDLRRAAELCRAQRVPEVKLYFMVGLPGETDDDVAAIASLGQEMAGWSGAKVTVSVGPFVPKAQTPFQRQAMLDKESLEERLRALRQACRQVGLSFRAEGPEWAAAQGVLARGDRRLAAVLLGMKANTLAEWARSLAAQGLDAQEYLRARKSAEPLPWQHIRASDRIDTNLEPSN
jgi:radical SAM superfamily enzyme YgiQ (UPF0313 family)